MRNVEMKNTKVTSNRLEIDKIIELVSVGDADVTATDEQIGTLQKDASQKRAEAQVAMQKKLEQEEKLQTLQSDVRTRKDELAEREARIRREEHDIVATESQLRDSKAEMENYLKEYDMLFRTTQKLTDDLESQMVSNEATEHENVARKKEIARSVTDIASIAVELAGVAKQKDSTQKKTEAIEVERQQYETERDDLKARIAQLSSAEIRTEWKQGEFQKKQIDDLKREKDILNRKLGSSEKAAALIFDLTKQNQNSKKNYENEVNGFTQTVKGQREQIEVLVHERERHEHEADGAVHRLNTAQEQLRLQEAQIADLQRKIIDGHSRLKQQQNLYEAVRSDRNLYSKNLIESQEEITEMKRKFKIMNHQIEQLKEEITAKDHTLVKEHFNHHNVDKEKEGLKNERTKVRKQIVSSEQIIANQRAEIQKLSQIIQEADDERQRQRKEHEAVIGERNILNTQLIKRNAELAAVYERIKIFWSSLTHGEARYQECVAELDFLTSRTTAMLGERNESGAQIENLDDLKYAKHQLERDLLHERTKIKALSEELDQPLNVHRHRSLQSSDPQRYEMIKKLQGLQKRIISKTQEVAVKGEEIEAKETLYVELKASLGRQPGPEVAEQIQLYASNLKTKNKQIRLMEGELGMYKEQVDTFRADLVGIGGEMDGMRREYLARQRAGGGQHLRAGR